MKRLRKLPISSIIYPCAKQNGNRPSGGTMDIIQKIKEELQVEKWQVEAAVKLIDEGNTIPFISRYRKEVTGSLNDEQLRNLDERLTYLRSLEDKKEQVLKSIEEQGKLTDELKEKILAAQTLVVVEDLYRPYRPKRKTRASIAKEKGLEPLAEYILRQEATEPVLNEAAKYISEEKEVKTPEEALQGAQDIIAEMISDDADHRLYIRNITVEEGIVTGTAKDEKAQSVYEMYYNFEEPVKKIAGHRVLALNRGEAEKVLTVKVNAPEERILRYLEKKLIEEYGEGSRVPIMKLRENEDPDVREIAEYVYQNIFLKYTMKQWGQKPEEISPEVTGRVPVVISYDNRYFKDKYQSVPLYGFTPMFEKMLGHENITVVTNTDCAKVLQFEDGKIFYQNEEFHGNLIYTGAIDELFGLRFGRLPYRSLDFQFEHLDEDSFQGHSVVNYTVSEDFTRITEFKFLTGQQDAKGTTIVREYPFAYTGAEGEIPYYAILEEKNQKLYEKYKALTKEYQGFYLLGRLAEYKYYNIDAMTLKAMELAEKLLK